MKALLLLVLLGQTTLQRSQICNKQNQCVTVTGNKLDVNASVSIPGMDPVLVQTVTGTVAVSSMPPVTVDPVLVQTVTPSLDAVWVTSSLGAGSAVSASQAGTWTVQPGNTANSTPWVVRIVDTAGSDLDVFKPNDLYTAANDHGLLILGQDAGAPARYRALLTNTSGAVRIDPTGTTTQPVSGTVGITGSVTVTDGAGALNVIVDSGTTAVTQSTSPWIVAGGGTAGAPGTAVLTVQGVGSGTPVPVSGSVTVSDGAGALNVIVDSGAVTATVANVSATGSAVPASAAFVGGGAAGGAGNLTGATVKAASTAAAASDTSLVVQLSPSQPNLTTAFNTNVAQINGVTPLMGNGNTGTGSHRVTVAADNTPFAVKIDQTTPGTTDKVTAVGPVAEAGGASGNPLRMGGVVEVEGAAMVSTNQVDQDISSLKTDEEGRLYVRTQHPNPFTCTLSAGTGDAAVCTDLSSSTTVYVTDVFVSNGATAGSIIINHGTGTACATSPTTLIPATYLAANTGFVWAAQTPFKITWASGLDICADITSLNPFSVQVRGYYFK